MTDFPSQKLAFLPIGTPQDVVDTYTTALEAVRTHPDFPEISSKRVGRYPIFVADRAQTALASAMTVASNAKAFVLHWLQDDYGVLLKAN